MAFQITQVVSSRTEEGIFHIDDLQILLIHEDIGGMEIRMKQNLCLSHVQFPQLVALQNHPGIEYQTAGILGIVRIQFEAEALLVAHIPVHEGHVVKDRAHFGVAEPDLQLPEGVRIQIIVGSVEMHPCQIICDLTCHFGEHNGLVQLEPGNLQMRNIFHCKGQIFLIVEIQFGKILGNDYVSQLHVVIFQSSPVHGHILQLRNTAFFPGLLQDNFPFSVADTIYEIDIAVAILFQRAFADGGDVQRPGKVKIRHFFFQIVCNILF